MMRMPASSTSVSSSSSSVPFPPPNSWRNTRSNSFRISSNFSVNCLRIPASSSSMMPCSVSAALTRSVCCASRNAWRSEISLYSSIAFTLTEPSFRIASFTSSTRRFNSLRSGISSIWNSLAWPGVTSYSSQRYEVCASFVSSSFSFWLFRRKHSLSIREIWSES